MYQNKQGVLNKLYHREIYTLYLFRLNATKKYLTQNCTVEDMLSNKHQLLCNKDI